MVTTGGPTTRSNGPPTVFSPTKLRLLEQNLGGNITFADGSLRTVTTELRKAWLQRSIPGKVNKVIQDWAPQQTIPRGLEERVAILQEIALGIRKFIRQPFAKNIFHQDSTLSPIFSNIPDFYNTSLMSTSTHKPFMLSGKDSSEDS